MCILTATSYNKGYHRIEAIILLTSLSISTAITTVKDTSPILSHSMAPWAPYGRSIALSAGKWQPNGRGTQQWCRKRGIGFPVGSCGTGSLVGSAVKSLEKLEKDHGGDSYGPGFFQRRPLIESMDKFIDYPAEMSKATIMVRSINSRDMIPSLGFRGGRSRTSFSPGSKAKATSWRPLVTRLIHKSWAGK